MKLIESKVEYLPQDKGLGGVYKQIEKCGRVSYKSEDKITRDSAEPFVAKMIKSKHGAVLEHGTIYLDMPGGVTGALMDHNCWSYRKNSYSKLNLKTIYKKKDDVIGVEHGFVTTNFRVLRENGWLNDLNYLCSPTEFHEKRYTFKFTCSRAIANELIRHRVFSFMQESQRFVNYSKEKFGSEITFIKPTWVHIDEDEAWAYIKDDAFERSCSLSEELYFSIINDGCTPQQARDVLPNATKTELIMTGFSSDWRYLLDLRLFGKTGNPHPDMLDLMKKLQEVAEEADVWDDIMKYPSKFD